VLTGALGLSASHSWYSGAASQASGFAIAPAFDWFVSDNISIGAYASYGLSRASGIDVLTAARFQEREYSLGLGPRVGGNLALSSLFSLYPTVGFSFGGGKYNESSLGQTNAASYSMVTVSLSVPLLVHAAPHFFIGAGPYLTHDLTRRVGSRDYQNRATEIGLNTLLGGWL
jgi:hypothetical protein